MSAKNMSLSVAGDDLGLADNVRQQLSDQESERKRKLTQLSKMSPFGPATMALVGQQLLGGAS